MTSKRANARSSSSTTAIVAAGFAAAAAAFVGLIADSSELTRWALCAVQAAALALVMTSELRGGRGWATSSFITGAAWGALFLVPSVLFTSDPSLFNLPDLDGTIAAVTASTTAFAAAYFAARTWWLRPQEAGPAPIRLPEARISVIGVLAGTGIGVAALGVIVMNAGGPIEYASSLNRTAGLNAGLFYVIAASLMLRWIPAAVIAQRWGTGRPAGAWVLTAYAASTVVLGVTGARLFLALALLEIALLYTLLRRPIPTRRVLVAGALIGVVVVFGLGTVKRYQSGTSAGIVTQSFWDYATSTAVDEVRTAYANNYVDTVRLVGMARDIVPAEAPYEGLRPIKQTLLKPIPSQLRPELERNPYINLVFSPPGEGAYAVPVQVTAWLAAGLIGVLLISSIAGLAVRLLDRALLAVAGWPAWRLLALVALTIELPLVIRSGIPDGLSILIVDAVGSAVAAWMVIRPPAALTGDAASASPSPDPTPAAPEPS